MTATSLDLLQLSSLPLLPSGYRGLVINPRSRKPPYIQVAEMLQAGIESGEYPKDERMPSEAELMKTYQIGRTTARKAIDELRKRGLVETLGTRGTFVL